MHRLTDLERIKHSLDLVWVLVRCRGVWREREGDVLMHSLLIY